jgi:hypothetical protein
VNLYTRDQFLTAARQQYAWLRDRLNDTERVRQQHEQARGGLAQAQANALNALASLLLPALTPDAVQRAIDLAGYAPWRAQPPTIAFAAMQRDLESKRVAIEADPLFRNQAALPQIRQQREAAKAFLDRVDHPRIDRLMELGYGTPQYDVGFWRLSYHQDHAAASRVIEAAGGRPFPEIAAEVMRARQGIAGLDAQIARTGFLADEHRKLAERLRALPNQMLNTARKQVTDHVMTVPVATMTRMLQRDQRIHRAYLEASGVSHKLGYLDHLVQRDVFGMRQKLGEEMARLQRDIAKFSRAKKWNAVFPVDKFQRRFRDRTPMFQKHWARYDRSYRMVYDYDDYWRARMLEDFLWWELMTRGRVDGSFIPGCSMWYAAHPGHQYVDPRDVDEDPFADAAAAAAEEEEERRRRGGGVWRDAS